jgi:nucleoside 2-deoxyribosyltransferase
MNESKNKTVYYAHSVHLYNTEQEKRDIILLESLGFNVFNPNTEYIQQDIKKLREKSNDSVMEYFDNVIDVCDILAFRSHLDGKIPSGVGYEIKYALKTGKPVFEIPLLFEKRFLSRDETKEYLKILGNR